MIILSQLILKIISTDCIQSLGKIVYQMENYNYDWDGTDYKTGNELSDGVYFVVTPNSEKYEHNSNKKKTLEKPFQDTSTCTIIQKRLTCLFA